MLAGLLVQYFFEGNIMNMNAFTSKNAWKCIVDGSEEVVDAAHDVIEDSEPQDSLSLDLNDDHDDDDDNDDDDEDNEDDDYDNYDDDKDDDNEDDDDCDNYDYDKEDDNKDDDGPWPVVPGRRPPSAGGGGDRSWTGRLQFVLQLLSRNIPHMGDTESLDICG